MFDALSFEPLLTPILFLLGAIFGSFANVIIYRLPRGESVVSPGSHCMSCGAPVRWYHNVPILAWFWLRGRCSSCGAKFSFRYPMVELVMAVLFAGAGHAIGFNWSLLEALLFIFGLVTCSVIDIDHMILPDKFTLSGIVIGLVGAALNPEREFLPAVYGVLMGGGVLWAIAYLYYALRQQEGMGGGDIKLLGWIGAVLGWKAIPVVILVSSIIGAIVGIALAIKTKSGLKHAIPFGPFLAAAALMYLLFDGGSWADWYLGLHGL